MYRQSPRSRGQRSTKGFKVRHGLQLILMLGVGVWLFYQAQRSYNHKDKSLGEDANISERLRLGRKDIPDVGDAEMSTRDSGDVKFDGNEKVGSKRKGNGGGYGIKNKVDDKKEVKKVGNDGMKEKNEKTRGGEMKGVVKDGKFQNLMSSNDLVQDGSDKDEKVMGEKRIRDIENGFALDARSVKSSNKESKEEVSDSAKSESSENVDSDDKQDNMTAAFSDETFASHSQNETTNDLGAKTRKGETGVDSYQSDTNADPTLKTWDSTAFSDTNGNEEANGVKNPRSSSSGTYENIRSKQPDTSHNSASQEEKMENKKEPSDVNNSQVKKEESSSIDNYVNKKQHEQVKSSNKVSEEQKEDATGEHHDEVNSSVSEEVKDRTDLDTLPNTDNQTHSKDAVAL